MGKKPTLQDFFGSNAREYEENRNLRKLQAETARRAIELLLEGKKGIKNEQILDLGCGTGWSMQALKEEGFDKIVGMDVSEDMLVFAREKGFTVLQADAKERLPFDNKEFGGIIAISTMNFIEEGCPSIDKILRRYRNVAEELFRVLKPGGRAVLQYFKKPINEKNFEENILKQFMRYFTGGVMIDDEGLRKEKRFLVIDKRK